MADAVDGDEVTLDGSDACGSTWVGTAASAELVTGVCSDDDAAFELAYDE